MVFDILQCNYKKSPVLTGENVVLNWSYQADCKRDARQVSFCIDVSDCSDFSTIIYTSSTIASDAMCFQLPDAVLQPTTCYFWRVICHDSYGETTISQTQQLETALLDSSVWERLDAHCVIRNTVREILNTGFHKINTLAVLL